MSKVMLVEDDNNLREIYEARLQAEGYTIVTAHDGEEALVVAKNEQPDLIISDVMMPKISGFEMLDILRNTDGLKDVKVIMLTALGQSDDQQRADRLGADSYLVKSQVTLEDIVKVAARLLGEDEAVSPVLVAPIVGTAVVPELVTVVAEPVALVAEPVVAVADPITPAPGTVTPAVVPEPVAVVEPDAPVAFGAPAPSPAAEPVSSTDNTSVQSEAAVSEALPLPAAQPLAEEAAAVEAQITDFEKATSPAPTEVEPTVEAAAPAPADEQFVTTAPPDLSTTVDPVAPTAQSAGNDDVLADALQSLTGSAPEAITVTARPPAAETTPNVNPTVPHGGNRVIAPLDTPTKPDIHTLLALEEAKEITNAPVVVPPADITVPTAASAPLTTPTDAPAVTTQLVDAPVPTVAPAPANAQPFDPNSIAL